MVAAKMEELRAQLEKLKEEKLAIERENERLKANQVRQDTEFNELRLQKEQMAEALLELQERNSAASAEVDALRERGREQLAEIDRLNEVAKVAESRWRSEIDKLTTDAELKRYHAVEVERNKWEAREERMVSELTTLSTEINKLRAGALTSSHGDSVLVVTSEAGTPATTESGVPSTTSSQY